MSVLAQDSGGRWHRFFVDAWVLFWNEHDSIDEEDLEDPPNFPVLDIGAEHGLEGSVILSVGMRATPEDAEFDGRLTISFGDGRALVLRYSEDVSRMSITPDDAAPC